MNMDSAVWAGIIGSLVLAAVAGASALIWRHVDNAQKEGEGAKERADAAHEEVQKVLGELHNEQVERLKFERHVAETYARTSGVERMETNIFAVMNRFETKLDKVLESSMQGLRHD